MRSFVRHSLTWMGLASYAVLSVVGTGWHALLHEHATSQVTVADAKSAEDEHTHCCHSHGSLDAAANYSHDDDHKHNHNHPGHDDDSCLVCQFVAQAQANAECPVVDSETELVQPSISLIGSQVARWLPAGYDSRGPPA